MTERREGGSIPKFILVTAILVALLVGGAYFVQQSRHRPLTTPEPVTELPGGEQKPAEESTTPPPANNVPQPSPNNSTTQTSPQNQTANRLPQSGPADNFMMVLILGILVGSGVSYIQSRRHLAPL